ncbi:MAG: hypothetical protein U5R30_10190 [Deltaproteobacteria bacterium]|nr:hypothetical protein [Deltaproteobacteria bacterium]
MKLENCRPALPAWALAWGYGGGVGVGWGGDGGRRGAAPGEVLTNKYIASNRFVYSANNIVVTETRYTSTPDVVFRWQTTVYPSIHKLKYVLLNPEDCGQRFNYGFIKIETVGSGTRVTHSSYFDFFGASLWAGLPGPIGMEAFLRYTARWEQETIMRLLPRYQPNTGK